MGALACARSHHIQSFHEVAAGGAACCSRTCESLQRMQDCSASSFEVTQSSDEPACAAAGAVPIPGAKTVEQVTEHLGALDWVLDDNEVGMLDERLDALKA